MNWHLILNVFIVLLEKVLKDSDGDGRPDMFDSDPKNKDIK